MRKDFEYEILLGAVDARFYFDAYPDVRAAGVDAAEHYMQLGWKERRDPAAWFSTRVYLERYPDLERASTNPLLHYLIRGRDEGYLIAPSSEANSGASYGSGAFSGAPIDESQQLSGITAPDGHATALVRSEFDDAYYLAIYPDVAAAQVDPFEHFFHTGWREGRNPTQEFSTRHYLESNPDVVEADINPFLHFVLHGRAEGRKPRPQLGYRFEILQGLSTLEDRLTHARRHGAERRANSAEQLRDQFALISEMRRPVLVSVSHDDYTVNFGGVQLCLMRESSGAQDRGYCHVHIFPSTPLPTPELERPQVLIGVLIDGVHIGFFPTSVVAREAAQLKQSDVTVSVHSLLGHNVREVISILSSAGVRHGFFWIHDYASVCAGFNLMRNDVQTCGAPTENSAACNICIYGESRVRIRNAYAELFNAISLDILAPSRHALDLWNRATNYPVGDAHVHEHCKLVSTPRPAKAAGDGGVVRVAFLGLPAAHKGWLAYQEIVRRFSTDRRYQFFHLGKRTDPEVKTKFVEVAIAPDNLDAMVAAVAQQKIDLAIVWSLWPETFCLAAYEAVAGGALVVTNQCAGNVVSLVRTHNVGSVLESERDLAEFFESGAAHRLVRARRNVDHHSLKFSEMTADFLRKEPLS